LETSQESYSANFTARAEICTPTYYEATLPVTVSVSGAVSKLSFDDFDLARRRTPVSPSLLNLERLDDLSFRGPWNKYMPGYGDLAAFEGVSGLLAKPFKNNQTDMLTNATLPFEASRLRRRFLGELLLSSVLEADVPVLESVTGQILLPEKQTMIVPEVAIPLALLFFLAACYFSVMAWVASTGRRPLHLSTDPATTTGTTSLVTANSSLATKLRALESSDRGSVRNMMDTEAYTLHANTITRKAQTMEVTTGMTSPRPDKGVRRWFKGSTPKKTVHSDWRPTMLHKRWLATFLTALIAIATTLLVLRKLAIEERLNRTAFVYQVDLGLFDTSFSPHSVITALIAVATALSWDGIDKPMRTLQPYLSMSRGSSEAPRGVLLSY
jgi:hypothetical protein